MFWLGLRQTSRWVAIESNIEGNFGGIWVQSKKRISNAQ
jgi:hypothetical protein